MAGANKGLSNLQKIPGQVVTGLGQLAAAGAPAFNRLTTAVGGAATRIGEQLGAAFESGALEKAVNTAVDLIADLGTVAGNVFATLGNIIAPVQAAGGGLIGVLVQITGHSPTSPRRKDSRTRSALAGVMATLAATADHLRPVLAAAGPIHRARPPIESLITNLGAAPRHRSPRPDFGTIAESVDRHRARSPSSPSSATPSRPLLPPLVPLLQAASDLRRGRT
jgi:hypothetical protein